MHGGFVTYTKANKTHLLGVRTSLLQDKGAVCPHVAAAMAEGALARSAADVAVSITGVAGPDPDEDGNPVGRVCIGLARAGSMRQFEYGYVEILAAKPCRNLRWRMRLNSLSVCWRRREPPTAAGGSKAPGTAIWDKGGLLAEFRLLLRARLQHGSRVDDRHAPARAAAGSMGGTGTPPPL